MSYFIFAKNSDNIKGTIFKIAENESFLNSLNIEKSNYKIIEDSQINFEDVKYGSKFPISYNNNVITYENCTPFLSTKKILINYVNVFKNDIKDFLIRNNNNLYYNDWQNYYTQLENLNFDNFQYPLDKSLEKYFNDLGQLSFNPLQLP